MARSRHTEDPTTPPDHELTAYERLAASRNGAQRCRFVDYYVEDPSSATAAAKAAGYKSRDMKQRAHELMNDSLVAAAIAQKMNERRHRTMITQDRVLNELAVIGFSDVGHYDLDPATESIALKEGVPEQALRAVSRFKATAKTEDDGTVVGTTGLSLWNKPKALGLMMKHLGMFDARLRVETEVTPPQTWKIGDQVITF